jgi:hypothetical protein
MKVEAFVAVLAFIFVIAAMLFMFNATSYSNIDWAAIFNIKTYPK